MGTTPRAIVMDAARDLRLSWRSLALTDIAYKAAAFALLTPAAMLLLRWTMPRGAEGVIADADILTVFVTTRAGVLTLVVGGALLLGITALEVACLMAIGLAAAQGRALTVRDALAAGAARVLHVLGLTVHMVVRVILGSLPFAAAGGLTYWFLLRDHDINFYLAKRPPAFWIAACIVGVIVAALAALLVRAVARWAVALPLVLFESVLPRRALAESARRTDGHRAVVLAALAAWVVVALAGLALATSLPEAAGRALAPHFAGSLPLIVLFVLGLALAWGALALLVGILNVSLFALLVVRLYLRVGEPREPRLPDWAISGRAAAQARVRRAILAGLAAVAALTIVGAVLLAVVTARRSQPVAVIAHRGSSATAPENSLAAFRLAVEQSADFVELDVQESADGEVLVAHDLDLMKVGGSPLRIWETDAATLRSVDIGSRVGPQFAAERVPTLAEALAVCKGKSRVIVELKSYGHDQRLEERVAEIVEAAGMANDCVFMSLDHDMVRNMKQLRPSWRSGVLVAKAIGDLTSLGADFLAVETRMATRAFVRRAHRAGQDVYVWTLNDPAWMLAMASRGVDGMITDKPDVARRVVARREEMSDAQRVLVALLVRLGARTESLVAEEALRP